MIDSPIDHVFDFTPTMLLFVDFDSEETLEATLAALADGDEVKMPLDDYGLSQKFGWITDRFGML